MVKNPSVEKPKRRYTRRQRRLTFYVLMFALPILQFLIFYIYVNFNSIMLAFQQRLPKASGRGYDVSMTSDFFKEAWSKFFSKAGGEMLWNSIQFLIGQLFIVTPLALLFSYYIAKEKAGSGFFRVMLYLPQVLSVVVLGLIYQFVLNDLYPYIAKEFFHKKVDSLLLPGTSSGNEIFYSALIFSLWFSFGTNVLIYTGAMSGVDESIVESARLDGVTSFQEFYHIYVPLIFSTVTTFIVTGLAGIFNHQMNLHVFLENAGTVDVFGYYFYRVTASHVAKGDTGVGVNFGQELSLNALAALGLIATVIIIPITLGVRKLLQKYGPRTD